MQEALFARRDDPRRGGFTLIEVVIALAIFLFGALAIVRIFPPALGIIQNSGDQLTAINLNRSTLAKFEQAPGLVPDATYDATPNFAGAVVGTALRNESLPRANIQNFDNTALGRFKNISRETTTVAGTDTAPYVITRYPYSKNQQVFVCEEDEVEGVTMRDDGRLDFSNATLKSTGGVFKEASNPLYPPVLTPSPSKNYLNNNTDGSFNLVGDTVFYVSYSSVVNSNIESIIDEPLVYPTSNPLPPSPPSLTSVTSQGKLKAAGQLVEPVVGPVAVRFRRLKYPAPVLPNAGATAEDNLRGIVDLPPALTPEDFLPKQAISLDYIVEDWRWLVIDESPSIKPEGMTAENFRAVTVPIRSLDKNQPVFTLLSTQDGDQNSFQKGRFRDPTPTGNGLAPPNSFGKTDYVPVDLKKGEVTFNLDSLGVNTSSARSRITYWTLDNWTHQLSVAARSYKPLYAGATPSVPAEAWRNYINPSTSRQFLYFRPSEAGKSVSVSFIHIDPDTGARVEVKNRVFQISQRTANSVPATNGVQIGGLVSELELTSNSGGQLSNANIISIQAVRGASIQARTAWLDGNRFTQVSSVGFRGVNN